MRVVLRFAKTQKQNNEKIIHERKLFGEKGRAKLAQSQRSHNPVTFQILYRGQQVKLSEPVKFTQPTLNLNAFGITLKIY